MKRFLSLAVFAILLVAACTGQEAPDCPADTHPRKRLADPTDCTAYYDCFMGISHRWTCQRGLFFNSRTGECDEESKALCPEPQLTCPEGASADKLYPHPTKCSKYYVCQERAVELNCPGGLHFNPVAQLCDFPKAAGCIKGKVIDADAAVIPCPLYTEELLTPDPTDCRRFYRCSYGNVLRGTCKPGYLFDADPEVEMCSKESFVDCGNRKVTIDCTRGSEIRGHPTNCSKFFLCVNGLPVERDCPASTHYNPRKQICDTKEAAGCAWKETFLEEQEPLKRKWIKEQKEKLEKEVKENREKWLKEQIETEEWRTEQLKLMQQKLREQQKGQLAKPEQQE